MNDYKGLIGELKLQELMKKYVFKGKIGNINSVHSLQINMISSAWKI